MLEDDDWILGGIARAGRNYLPSQVGRVLSSAKELLRLLALSVLDLLEIEESDIWASPDDPESIVLRRNRE